MSKKMMGIAGMLAAGFVLLGSLSASAGAVDQVNGQGQTPLGASIGFNADASLAGQLTYNADPKGATPGFWAQCDSFTTTTYSYNKFGFPIARAWATCTDQDGNTVYLRASFVDRGEPGTRDSVCIVWSYDPSTKEATSYIHEMGKISNGNIQIHE
jgi:hypothetical protein